MCIKAWFRILFVLFFTAIGVEAQTMDQPNIDFETGGTSVWNYYIGRCCPLVLDTLTASALPDRHTITSGNGLDYFGNFPIVCPGGGNYSMRLGNNINGSEAERAEYYVHVPAGLTNYSLVFRYAVVFQEPGHPDTAQPRFAVNAYDSATGAPIECAQYLFVASSALPGFKDATETGGFGPVKYKEWTTASINLSGYEGRTVIVHFTSGDCAYGAHFAYGYIDISGGLFAVSTVVCNKHEALISGPGGFDKYYWYDSTFTNLIDSSQFASLPNPTGSTKYAVILKPFPGFGCPDTLFTSLRPSDLDMNRFEDMVMCNGSNLNVTAVGTGGEGVLRYAWAPEHPEICGNCETLTTRITDSVTLRITISDTTGCNISDTFRITLDSCSFTLPNAFTPNNDGKNDIFRVIGIGLNYYKNFSFNIFNRYGQRVYFSKDIYAGWDGVFNDVPQDIGVFFYMVIYTLDGEQKMLKGDVTLVK